MIYQCSYCGSEIKPRDDKMCRGDRDAVTHGICKPCRRAVEIKVAIEIITECALDCVQGSDLQVDLLVGIKALRMCIPSGRTA